MTDFTALRAEAARTRAAGLAGQERAALPGGEARREDVKFATEFRAEKVQKDGRDMFLVEGYASTTERAYEMWDFFGPYEEVVSRSAFDQTLSTKPLVVYRFNHAGTPMASTRNGRLELWNDSMGLGDRAWLNPERDDVQLLMHAVEDGDVGEQSMMFQIEEGVWNDDYTEFRIDRVNLDRGDVGPVTYGANPHTMVAARSGELLAAIPSLPPQPRSSKSTSSNPPVKQSTGRTAGRRRTNTGRAERPDPPVTVPGSTANNPPTTARGPNHGRHQRPHRRNRG
jgi:phage head maturation protease